MISIKITMLVQSFKAFIAVLMRKKVDLGKRVMLLDNLKIDWKFKSMSARRSFDRYSRIQMRHHRSQDLAFFMLLHTHFTLKCSNESFESSKPYFASLVQGTL